MVRRGLKKVGAHAFGMTAALLAVIPLWWMLVSSMRSTEEVFSYSNPFKILALIPTKIDFGSYVEVLNSGFGRSILNTLFVGAMTVIGSIIVNGTAGYAFARMEFRGKNVLFVFVVLMFVVPFEAVAIPLYQIVSSLGFINTYWALIIPAVPNGIVIFLFRQFFLAVPKELEEAARIDGAGPLRILWYVYLPVSLPVLVTVTIIVFVTQWESFLWPLLATQSPDLRVVQLALGTFHSAHSTQWSQLFAAATLAAIVPMCVIWPLQRYYRGAMFDVGVRG
jgi:multiple sugar transport system permease protein/putative chitobiose transport system permease protein